MADAKEDGAMLAIGELANRIGVPTHILRYWETRFPELKPLQRSGRRRYYRAEDVGLVERIHELLHHKGYTVEGARRALAGEDSDENRRLPISRETLARASDPEGGSAPGVDVMALIGLRQRLVRALEH
jgi:DNA-binding transcriptional MerR regulator